VPPSPPRGEGIQVLVRSPVQSCIRGPDNPTKIAQCFFIDLVIFEQLRVVAKIAKKPIEFPISVQYNRPEKRRVSKGFGSKTTNRISTNGFCGWRIQRFLGWSCSETREAPGVTVVSSDAGSAVCLAGLSDM